MSHQIHNYSITISLAEAHFDHREGNAQPANNALAGKVSTPPSGRQGNLFLSTTFGSYGGIFRREALEYIWIGSERRFHYRHKHVNRTEEAYVPRPRSDFQRL